MDNTKQSGRARFAALTIALAALVTVGGAIGPAVATADTGSTSSVKVLNAPSINPPATGGSFTVDLAANGAVAVSGAGAGLSFDKTRLALTALARGSSLVSEGAICFCLTIVGFPSAGGTAAFIASANATGSIPVIGFAYTDGLTSRPANADVVVYSATFKVVAPGNSDITPTIGTTGGILDGRVGTYGSPLTIDTVGSGHVANPAPLTGSITTLAPWLATNTVAVKWGGTPGANAIATYDVRYRKAAYNALMPSTYTTWQNATALTTANFTTAPGTTYCFSARARDTSALVSAWTAETCTAAPLDDRSFARSGSWSLKTSASFYRSTYLLSTASGAKLTRTSVKAKRIALVATTCSTCGKAQVYLGTKLLKTVSLYSATTVNKKLITVYTFSSVTSGTLYVKVYGSGKKVMIDGVVISAR